MFAPLPLLSVPDIVPLLVPEWFLPECIPSFVCVFPEPIVEFEPAGAGAVAPCVVGLFRGVPVESLGVFEGAPAFAAKAEPEARSAPVIIADAM